MKLRLLVLSSLFMSTLAVQAQDVDMKDEALVFDEAVGTAKIGVIVKNKNANPTTVNVSLVSNFGTAGSSDITLTTTQLTFPATSPDPDTQYIDVTVANDMLAEKAEYFAVKLTGATNGNIGDETTVVYIKDNDYKAPVARRNIELQHLGSYKIPSSGASAEIVDYDSASNRLFVVNSLENELHILSFATPGTLTKVDSIDMSVYGGGINSVAVHDGVVAVAVEANPKTDSGSIVFLDINGGLLKQVKAGFLPDMVCFTHDGKYVLTANEGEPNDKYTIDPDGSVTIVDISNGVASATVKHITFTAYNGMEKSLRAMGIRIYGNNNASSTSQDFEPEYITTSKTSDTAWVTLQENNAIAVIHIPTQTLLDIKPLGYADHMQPDNALDASDKSSDILIANWPVRGLYLPDALGSYEVNGKTYLVLANEGDSRDYDGYSEEKRIGSSKYKLDPIKFPNADLLKADYNLGRLTALTSLGDTDNDGDFDEIYVMGSRSFTVVDPATGMPVFSSGDQFEQIIAVDPKVGKIFNASNDDNSAKNRSDNKGPEPEGVAVATIRDTTYAFIGLERIGGVMVYDVTNPNAAVFVDYINTRDTSAFGGDNGCEGMKFISRGGKYYLVTANEVSGTVAVFEVKVKPLGVNNIANALPALNVYPNPAQRGQVYFSTTISGSMVDMNGHVVASFNNANGLNTSALPAGIYLLKADGFAVQKVVVQ